MRILYIDIETTPQFGWWFGRAFEQHYISQAQILEHTDVLCFAARWKGETAWHFHTQEEDGWLQEAWKLLDEADVVVTWNGKHFDIPHLNREFIVAGLKPPSPYKHIDLYLTARKRFYFASNKLGDVAEYLLGEQKVAHEGFKLWIKCMDGDLKAWKTMESYNKQDVVLLEKLYPKLLPWIIDAPSATVYNGDERLCTKPGCGGHLQKRGFAYTAQSKYQQFVCEKCGAWTRGTTSLSRTHTRQVTE